MNNKPKSQPAKKLRTLARTTTDEALSAAPNPNVLLHVTSEFENSTGTSKDSSKNPNQHHDTYKGLSISVVVRYALAVAQKGIP